jgi:predicted aconitase
MSMTTVNRVCELLNPVTDSAEMMKNSVKGLEYIISFYGFPIKFVDRMTVVID